MMRWCRRSVQENMSNTATVNIWNPVLYRDAYWFAAEAHQGQEYPGTGLPYIMHLSMVAMEVMTCLAQERHPQPDLAVQCALLHDVIEDTPVTHSDVAKRFGLTVADGVLALTKNADLPKPEAMADSLTRIREQPREIWLVKLADRISNLGPPPHYWSVSKKQRYQAEAETIFAALHTASPVLATRLTQRIADYDQYLEA